MRKLLIFLALLPTTLLSQNSWINIQLLTDDYPEETSWTITPPGGSPIIAQSGAVMAGQTLHDTIVELGGTIVVNLYDEFGDGLGGFNGSPQGWFMISNLCQDTLMYVAGDFGDSLVQTLTVAPCAPPTEGCTDPNALNYDSTAYISNPDLCAYPPCSGLLTSTASQTCLPNGQALVYFNWTLDSNPNCTPVNFWYSNEEGVGPFQYEIGPEALDFGVYAGNGQMPPNWSVEHYGVVEFTDGSLSDTIFYTPTPCILGCTDPIQTTYNPWATIDDGTCAGTTCDPATEYQITMEITFDNWPGETSWIMNSGGTLDSAAVGDYDFNDIGQTYTYNFCIDQNAGFELIVNDTYGDGMAGATSGGTMNGTIVIYDCNGDTIWAMDNPGFGNVLYSGPQVGVVCNVTSDILGCMDDDYQEFNPQANIDDGSCVNLHVYGCIDSEAFNYDPNATMMDLVQDCSYELWIGDAGGDGWGNSYIGVYQNGIDLGTYTMGPGNYEQTFNIILDPGVPVEVFYFEVGGPQQPPQEIQFQTWHNSFKLTNADGFVLLYEGQNPFADNGNGALQGFDSPFFTKYVAIPFCGNSCIPTILGCMDSTSFNYNSLANTDDGNCIPVTFGCTNDLAFNYDPNANTDDGSCQSTITGCMDINADNYNSSANTDDGSCYYIGCMDVLALNYDSTATVSSGCIYPIYGCTDPDAFNYDPNANTDNGSCIDVVYGCTDVLSFNYNPLANTENGSCTPFVYGCIDSTALNYNPLANTDNGTCILPITGCTDPSAANYNPLANVTDSTACLYDAGCYQGEGLPYWLNDGCFAWVIDVDNYCCTNDWDASCQTLYDYCQDGWPVGVNELEGTTIVVYPNPSSGIFNIDTRLDIDVEVWDMSGRKLINTKETRIDLREYDAGVYNMIIIYNNIRFNKRVIKQ